MNVQVKICGIRRLDAAQTAVAAGADFVGFNFVPHSRRYIDPHVAKAISIHIKGKIQMVGVFQNENPETVNAISELLDLDLVQLHGEENEAYFQKITFPIIKRVDVHRLQKSPISDFLLLDRDMQGQGNLVDFEQAKKVADKFPIFLAGGLESENVALAIQTVRPFAVDVAGGVETNGQGDSEKIQRFVKNAKTALFGKV